MTKKFPVAPKSPHRICWGCDKYCPADTLACGNGSERTLHPIELFGEDWLDWGPGAATAPSLPAPPSSDKTRAAVGGPSEALASPDDSPTRWVTR